MGISTKINQPRISREKLKEIRDRSHFTVSKPMSQEACENFNRILAKAQLRVYREFLETK